MKKEREKETWDQYAGIELTLICHLWTEDLNQSVVHVCGDSKVISELFASEDGGFSHISDLTGLHKLCVRGTYLLGI